MKFPRNAKIFRGQLDVAPLAGVFFLLAIFLLLNSSLVFISGVRIELPESSREPLPGVHNPTVVVAMDLYGRIYFENQVLNESELETRLKSAAAHSKDLVLIIQADKNVQLKDFYRLSHLASQAGIAQVLLASKPALLPQQPIDSVLP